MAETEAADVRADWNVRIPLRDGARLAATLYLPREHSGRSPAICTLTPYVAQSHHAHAVQFARHGYPFLTVDVRGRGDSEGEFHPLNEARDGYDVVEWLAGQSYCNGQVAMWGASYLGRCQWVTAAERAPHLATIVPTAAPYYGVDVPLRNNVFVPYTIRWLTLLLGRALHDKQFADQVFWTGKFRHWFESGIPFRQLDGLVGNPSALFQEWVAHPERGSYWDRYNPTPAQYAQLRIPILTITGAYDADQPGALEHYRQHMRCAPPAERARHYLIIGPWDHGGTSVPKRAFGGLELAADSVVDLAKLHRQWYSWVMQNGPKPEFLRKNVAYYVTGAERWQYADSLDEVTARCEPVYLQAASNPADVFGSGSLSSAPPTSGVPGQYVYDPRDIGDAELESTMDPESIVDQRLVLARSGKQLVYHSAPFTDETLITGFFRLAVWIGIDAPDTDIIATVYEIGRDGSALLLTRDWVRCRYREGLQRARLIDTRDPLLYRFERFTFVARRVRRGHRLRLVVGPINSLEWQKNHNGGGVVSDESIEDSRPVTVRLHHDAACPSTLYVPFGVSD